MELYQSILLWFSFLVFSTYIGVIYLKYGIQSSVSMSFYTIEKHTKHPMTKWLLPLSMLLFSFPLIIVGVEIHPLFFWAGLFIMFTASAPAFKFKNRGKAAKVQHNVHMVGAIGGISFGVLAFLAIGIVTGNIAGYITVGLLTAVIGLLTLFRVPNTTWWVETAAYYGTWLGMAYLAGMSLWNISFTIVLGIGIAHIIHKYIKK